MELDLFRKKDIKAICRVKSPCHVVVVFPVFFIPFFEETMPFHRFFIGFSCFFPCFFASVALNVGAVGEARGVEQLQDCGWLRPHGLEEQLGPRRLRQRPKGENDRRQMAGMIYNTMI